jgi:hypothetical protein
MTKEIVPEGRQIQERKLVDLGEAEHVEVVAQQLAVLLLHKKLRNNQFKQLQSLSVNRTDQKQIIIVRGGRIGNRGRGTIRENRTADANVHAPSCAGNDTHVFIHEL